MKCLWVLFTIMVLLAATDAKKKKFDGDFEFADEVSFLNSTFYSPIHLPLDVISSRKIDCDNQASPD